MRTCYVALPWGIRPDPDGRRLDFDHLYNSVLQPTIREAGLDCRRLEEFPLESGWHRNLFMAILSCDVMIADVSTHNPNVMYELGIRHALKRGRTLTISAGGRLPSNIGDIQALFYQADDAGRLTGAAAEEFRKRLRSVLQLSGRTTISDSPVYEYFPEIDVILPPEVEAQTAWRSRARSRRAGGTGPGTERARGAGAPGLTSRETMVRQTRQREEEARTAGADPIEFLSVLRHYRDLSAWDDLIRSADEAPPSVAQSPEVRQLLALALNRHGETADQDRAIAVMEQLIKDTGGDAEMFGVLGRIYKDRFEAARKSHDPVRAAENLERALSCYRASFEKNPKDIYTGFKVVSLLLHSESAAAQEELQAFLPRIRAAERERIDPERPDPRDIAIRLQLAAVAGDWGEAESAARAFIAVAEEDWLIESTRRELRELGRNLGPEARQRLGVLRAKLAEATAAEISDE